MKAGATRKCSVATRHHTPSPKREYDLMRRRTFLPNCWYAAGVSAHVEPHNPPLQKEILGEQCALQRCPESGRAICETATGKTWHCEEHNGWVWVYFSDASPSEGLRPLVPFSEWSATSGSTKPVRSVHGEVTIDACHWMVAENVVDMAHVPYVHRGTVGDHAAFTDINVQSDSESMWFDFPIDSHASNDVGDPLVRVHARAVMTLPSTSMITFSLPFGGVLRTLTSVVPIDENRTRIMFKQDRDFLTMPILDPLVKRGMLNILGEDKRILESLDPSSQRREVSSRADIPTLTFRSMRERRLVTGS